MEYEKKAKIKFICLSVFFYLFFGFLMTLGVVHYIDDQGKADAIKGGVIVQAEWVGIIPNSHHSASISTTYDLGYEYIDENGVRYREQCLLGTTDYEEAKSYMGKKVDIYIDGKGHSIAVYNADDFNRNFAWWLMGISIGLTVLYTAGIIIIPVLKRKYPDSWLNH